MGERGRLDRLSFLDVSNLRIEDRGAPAHVAALLILDRPPAVDAGRLTGLAAVRARVGGRLYLAPRLRQVLYRPPPGLGLPVWTDYPDFDICQHVHGCPVSKPGDEATLLATCAELNLSPLDRSRPLWDMWLLTGLAGGRAAILIRLHHVLADGAAALAMLSALAGEGQDEPAPGSAWMAAPAPGLRELAADRLSAARRALSRLREPGAAAAQLGRISRQAAELAREGRAPRVSVNVPVTRLRRLALVRADLERARTAGHAHGGTVNDVALVLKASVAVSLRARDDMPAGGNRVGVMIAPLPVGEPDADRRLIKIAAATSQRKTRPAYQPSSRLLQRWMIATMARQRLINLLVSNLPGPVDPLSFADARVLELFQLGLVQGNVPVSVGAISYAGQLNLAVVADGAMPDLDAFTAGMAQTLDDLHALVVASAG